MTQTGAICQALLNGDVLTIFDGYKRFSCTNLPRELSRSVENKFGVTISKEKVNFKPKFDGAVKVGFYYRYRLNNVSYNEDGIEKMKAYVIANGGQALPTKRPVGRPKEKDTTPIHNSQQLF